jgi:hypothetical protein
MAHTTLGILYEHPDWFRPVFAELDRRGIRYTGIDANRHGFDPTASDQEYGVLLNRMSPSAYLREGRWALAHTGEYLAHMERTGARVINGSRAWRHEVSKARQVALLSALTLPHPATRIANHPSLLPDLAEGLEYPVIVKPNVGGSGAGVRRFDTAAGLRKALDALDGGADGVLLVQECIPAESDRIVRVEVLDGRFLYAIRIYTSGDRFDLCPADVCRTVDGAELLRSACPVDAPENDLRVEAYEPPPEIVGEVERIMDGAGIELGGVEYMVDERNGERVYYDINALSNFVADGPTVLGFDPFERLGDWLEAEVARHGPVSS